MDGAEPRDVGAVERAGHVEDDAQQIGRQPGGQQVDGDRDDDRIAAAPQVELGEDDAHREAGERGAQSPDIGRSGEVGADDGRERAGQDHALEADVKDACPLADRAAERCEQKRRQEARHGGQKCGVEEEIEHPDLLLFARRRREQRPGDAACDEQDDDRLHD